tara:strand:+ start:45 stop:221 length:177 start_codon:yes stop_codon:yes gene_type:complete
MENQLHQIQVMLEKLVCKEHNGEINTVLPQDLESTREGILEVIEEIIIIKNNKSYEYS